MSEETPTESYRGPNGWRSKNGFFAWHNDKLMIPPMIIGMSEPEALLCCGFDGATLVQHKGMLLVSEEWARNERPSRKEDIDEFCEAARAIKELAERETAEQL